MIMVPIPSSIFISHGDGVENHFQNVLLTAPLRIIHIQPSLYKQVFSDVFQCVCTKINMTSKIFLTTDSLLISLAVVYTKQVFEFEQFFHILELEICLAFHRLSKVFLMCEFRNQFFRRIWGYSLLQAPPRGRRGQLGQFASGPQLARAENLRCHFTCKTETFSLEISLYPIHSKFLQGGPPILYFPPGPLWALCGSALLYKNV